MASKRKMVFGYRMELGDIVPSPNEAETVRYIYTRYLAGASFQCLANELNQKALPYHTGKSWNKNMVARILEDSRYVGADLYPPIISAEQLQAVRERRKKNCTASPPLPVQAELYKLCGSAVPGSAVEKIRKALNHLIDDPLRISMAASAVCDTAEIRQLQQELDTLLQARPVDEDAARQKALEVASLKLASAKTEEYESHRLRGVFETHPKMDALDAALLKQSLRKIECHSDTVCLLLKNGQWLEA